MSNNPASEEQTERVNSDLEFDVDSDVDCEELCPVSSKDNPEDQSDDNECISNDIDDDLPIDMWLTQNNRNDDDVPLSLWFKQNHNENDKNTSSSNSAQHHSKSKQKKKPPFPTVLPSFHPLFLDPSRCSPNGRPNYFTFRSQSGYTPLAVFKYFLPEHLVSKVVYNTKKYAKAKNAGLKREWVNVTKEEMLVFVGLCLCMGVFRSPRVEDYWDKSGRGSYHLIMSYMSLKRFQQIKRYLHVCDHDGDNGDTFFFNKEEPFFSHIFDVSRKLWFPSTFLSADEMMVMNYGRSSETVRMRNKPIGSGFKIWAICDSGYTYYAFPHSNKYPWYSCQRYKGELTHSLAVVATLSDVLPRHLPFIRADGKHMYAIFMDNLFATPKLFALLKERDIAACGTVRSTAKGFPSALATRGKEDKKLNWDTIGALTCADGKVLALTWIDNGAVQMLTTMHKVGKEHSVERVRKRPRLTSTNGGRVRAVFGNNATMRSPIPRVVDDYNFNMGGVDIADQLRSAYTSHLPSRRTWMPLFFWLLDTAANNSYIILKNLSKEWVNKHRDFLVDLSWQLVKEQNLIEESITMRRDGTTRRGEQDFWCVSKRALKHKQSNVGLLMQCTLEVM